LVLASTWLLSCRREGRPPPERAASAASPEYEWAVDPGKPGSDNPSTGQSLFDLVITGPLPFPFSALIDTLETRLRAQMPASQALHQGVLVPLGRSLQRFTAAPQFFRFPRAVVVFEKAQLFLAYQEKGAVIEVLSYNEQAGRFEFELVKDYRTGGRPYVEHAKRSVCTVCHQNQAPIFPRQLWDETNANPLISQLLAAEGKDFYGITINPSADTPYAIDLAVHRANELSVAQLIWKKADPLSRAAWSAAMLTCRLQKACALDSEAAELAAQWRRWWPRGLAVPNPEIPNRNPVSVLSREGPYPSAERLEFLAVRQLTIERRFEPAIRRKPLAIWEGTSEDATRMLLLLASYFQDRELGELRARIKQNRRRHPDPLSVAANQLAIRASAGQSNAFAAPCFRPVAILKDLQSVIAAWR
jgi:hypothetical protein